MNLIHQMLFHTQYTYLLLSLILTTLVAPNEQLGNVKLLGRIFGQSSKS